MEGASRDSVSGKLWGTVRCLDWFDLRDPHISTIEAALLGIGFVQSVGFG